MDIFGHFGIFWTFLIFLNICKFSLDIFGHLLTFLDMFEHIWTFLDYFGYSNIFVYFEHILLFCHSVHQCARVAKNENYFLVRTNPKNSADYCISNLDSQAHKIRANSKPFIFLGLIFIYDSDFSQSWEIGFFRVYRSGNWSCGPSVNYGPTFFYWSSQVAEGRLLMVFCETNRSLWVSHKFDPLHY